MATTHSDIDFILRSESVLSRGLQSPPPANGPQPVPEAPPPSASAAPVSPSSTEPYIILNLGMRIFGQQMLPFTPELQYTIASSLAAVFSIIVGSGSVQLLSSSPVSVCMCACACMRAHVPAFCACVHMHV